MSASEDRRSGGSSRSLAEEFLAASAALPTDRVIIVGSDQLKLLIALLRCGFAKVDCLSAICGPHPPRGEADIVIAPDVRSVTELHNVLHRFACTLRPRGVLLMHAADVDFHSERRIRQMFLNAGFAALERLPCHDGIGHLWCARNQPVAMARAA